MLITETTRRFTPVILSAAPRSPMAILADMDRLIQAQTDRFASEDTAWKRNPLLQCHDAGHRCLLVDRNGVPTPVWLGDLTEADLDGLL